MASNTRSTWKRRVRKHSNMGKKRKAKDSKRSTLSTADLFADLGAPAATKPAAAKPVAKTAK